MATSDPRSIPNVKLAKMVLSPINFPTFLSVMLASINGPQTRIFHVRNPPQWERIMVKHFPFQQ